MSQSHLSWQSKPVAVLAGLLASCTATYAQANSGSLAEPVTLQLQGVTSALLAVPGSQEPAPAASASADKSGTDPTKFLRAFRITNELARTTNENWSNTTAFSFVQPFADSKMNLRLKVPVIWTDVTGSGDWGIGDLSLRYNWLAKITQSYGLLVGAEVVADTASEDFMGRGKWTAAPLATFALFLSKNMIFAPTYQHNFSFAGDSDRADVNESVLDFYFVITADDKQSWVTIDPTIVIDWENDQNTPATLEVQYGWKAGELFGGAFNMYIQPGIGIGQDRPYEWNIEFGINIVGF
jgi:hypothetical protein